MDKYTPSYVGELMHSIATYQLSINKYKPVIKTG